jgi:hypothetical protein
MTVMNHDIRACMCACQRKDLPNSLCPAGDQDRFAAQ